MIKTESKRIIRHHNMHIRLQWGDERGVMVIEMRSIEMDEEGAVRGLADEEMWLRWADRRPCGQSPWNEETQPNNVYDGYTTRSSRTPFSELFIWSASEGFPQIPGVWGPVPPRIRQQLRDDCNDQNGDDKWWYLMTINKWYLTWCAILLSTRLYQLTKH